MTFSDFPKEILQKEERRFFDIEKRLETRIRVLEKENTVLAAQLERRFEELSLLTRMMQEKELQLDSVLNSTSWRITRPLRWIIRRLRAE